MKNKTAQKIIVHLYLRYRMNRKLYNDCEKLHKNAIQSDLEYFEHAAESVKWDSWNALQSSKQIYYENL